MLLQCANINVQSRGSSSSTSSRLVGLESFVTPGALHEVFTASPADTSAAICFALGLLKPGRLLWVRQRMVEVERGTLYPPGLAAFGFDPSNIIFMSLRDVQSVLQAGLEAARIKGLSGTIIELWGIPKPYTLTASRKLMLAAKASGVALHIIIHAGAPIASAAETRWLVRRRPSQILAGHAPGFTAFEVTLLRHRSSARTGQVWSVEWNHEKRCFENGRESISDNAPPLFKPVVSLPVFRKIPFYKAA